MRLLPVPFSPVMSTLAPERPTRRTMSSTDTMAGASAMRSGGASGLRAWRSLSRRSVLRSARDSSTCVRRIGEQAGVVPRLLHEVPGAAAHRLDHKVDAPPGGHDDDGEGLLALLDFGDEVEAFLAGRRVARVVQVHQDRVEVPGLDRVQQRRRRAGGLDAVAFGLEQEPQGLEHVGLIVGDQNGGVCAHAG